MSGETAAELTGDETYLGSFEVGDVYRHGRGKTVTQHEMQSMALSTMNTAEAHFNADKMAESEFGSRINYGGVTMSIVFGLASRDTSENAVRTVGLEDIRFPAPVRPGDTLYALTEVVAIDEDGTSDPDTGLVTFEHYGTNQDEELVFSGTRTCIVRRAPEARQA